MICFFFLMRDIHIPSSFHFSFFICNFVPLFEKNVCAMAKVKGTVVVNTERCKGCNLCVVACPSDVLELYQREVNDKGYHYVYMKQPDECIGCANCGVVCPDGCLTIYKVKVG
jgi:2-oxoglutarate ferredoxin oxidoreductase subunit delta